MIRFEYRCPHLYCDNCDEHIDLFKEKAYEYMGDVRCKSCMTKIILSDPNEYQDTLDEELKYHEHKQYQNYEDLYPEEPNAFDQNKDEILLRRNSK